MDSTRTRIIAAAIQGVRQYGLEGVRVQNISKLAGLTPGAMYRYFKSKKELMETCFACVDRQAAAIFDALQLTREQMVRDPLGAVKSLWLPYFRFWVTHPNETVFYHRFRDSAYFPAFDKKRNINYFKTFIGMVRDFYDIYPALHELNTDLLWLYVLTGTVMYAKYVVEGLLPNTPETEEEIFQLLCMGLSRYLKPQN